MIKLTVAGDVFPGNLPYHIGSGVASAFKKHGGSAWQSSFRYLFNNSDIGLVNLESPLLRAEGQPWQSLFAGSHEFVDFLNSVGINVVNVANNHILEHGLEGFRNTLDLLDESRIAYIGSILDGNDNVYRATINGVSVAISGFNSIHDIDPVGYGVFSIDEIMKCIKKMGGVDFKILSLHWGNEYIQVPSYDQIETAKMFIDAGVDVIIGHHPHVIQPVMQYKNGLILFSLGNCLFDMTYAENVRFGLVVDLELAKGSFPRYFPRIIRIADNYSPDLIGSEHSIELLESIDNLFYQYLKLDKHTYNIKYCQQLKLNRVLQRILMKKDLVINLHRLSSEDIKLITKKFVYRRG